MCISRRTAKLILGLCLLVFQAQVLAAVLLGCRHGQSVGEAVVQAVCPFHQTNAEKPDDGGQARLLDCTKCALHCAIGAVAPFAAELVAPAVVIPGRPAALPGRHFYRFIPEADFRPPISRLL